MTESSESDGSFDITDMWTIAAIEACGHVATSIHGEVEQMYKGGSRRTLIYTFAEDAKDDYEAWMRSEIREPFITIRKVQQSAKQFKNNLYRHCR